MRQKFHIYQDSTNDDLKIREMAVVDKDFHKLSSSLLRDHHYTLLCEETYDRDLITEAIDRGVSALVTAIRTPNLFPVRPFCLKIAESVMVLYASKTKRSMELSFDDVDMVATPEEAKT
jgi:hypothetical protein